MNRILISLLCLTNLILTANAEEINQVYVEGSDIGQGFTVKRLNQCYYITPLHVVENEPFLTLKGSDKLRSFGDGEPLQDFGYDLSVGLVIGAMAKYCGLDYNALSVDQTDIDRAKTVVVTTVNSNGLISRMPAVIEETSLTYLSAKSLSDDNTFYKGMSGSLVYSEKQLIGMLQSVDSSTGFGRVLRLDRLIETVKPLFSSSHINVIKKAAFTTESDSIPYELSAWNLAPTSNTRSPQLITDADNKSYFATSVNSGYLELDFIFREQQDVKSIKLLMPENSGIKDFEIMSSRRDAGKRGWVSVKSGTVMPKETETVVQLGKVNARRLKLKIRSSWNSDGLIKLAEVSIF